MKTPRTQIAGVIIKHLANVSPQRLAKEVAAYLLNENRTDELDSLMRDVVAERALTGTVEVTAVSAHRLSEAALKDIEAEVRLVYPQAEQIIISPKIDTNLLGGVRLEFPNAQLDLSLRAKLNELKTLITYGKDAISG
ncbi:F0F1 ATP synthase subunit delta [Patescibacteria group bacterium]|nr:F0F1 ATP synthase subunit delta [Patescibacteria group bacterium]